MNGLTTKAISNSFLLNDSYLEKIWAWLNIEVPCCTVDIRFTAAWRNECTVTGWLSLIRPTVDFYSLRTGH
jgi:hypothetical protein